MTELALGIDLGTSYFKLGLFDQEGLCRGLGRVAVAAEVDNAGHCELPLPRFWLLLREALAEAMRQAKANCSDICGVSYASQANSFLLLTDTFDPLTPLILWPDARAKTIPETLEPLCRREDFLATTGLGLDMDFQFAAAKIRWFQQQHPRLWRQTRRVMTLSDYLTWSLTGQTVGDAGTACLLGLLDVQHLCWWEAALAASGIPAEFLSTPLRPGTPAGFVSPAGAEQMALPAGIPFVTGSLDHHQAAAGAGLEAPAEMSVSLGTVLAVVRLTREYRPARGVGIGPAHREGEFFWLAFSGNGAATLEWYRNTFAPQYSLSNLLRAARSVPVGCDGLVALPDAREYPEREGFRNISSSHTPAHFTRAILESTGRSLVELVNRLWPAGRPEGMLATGGGAKSELWREILSEAVGVPCRRAEGEEPACRGAALSVWRYLAARP